MSMDRISEFRKCIWAMDSSSCLRRTIEQMMALGIDKDSILADLNVLKSELRTSGNEKLEDVVLDAMDCVVGWCSPHQRFLENRVCYGAAFAECHFGNEK